MTSVIDKLADFAAGPVLSGKIRLIVAIIAFYIDISY